MYPYIRVDRMYPYTDMEVYVDDGYPARKGWRMNRSDLEISIAWRL